MSFLIHLVLLLLLVCFYLALFMFHILHELPHSIYIFKEFNNLHRMFFQHFPVNACELLYLLAHCLQSCRLKRDIIKTLQIWQKIPSPMPVSEKNTSVHLCLPFTEVWPKYYRFYRLCEISPNPLPLHPVQSSTGK